jgi:hypothetical protein
MASQSVRASSLAGINTLDFLVNNDDGPTVCGLK